jgi:hypothetical protein
MNVEYTNDPGLLRTPQYHKIKECIDSLSRTGDSRSFAGNCVATCDIFQTLLSQLGIACKIMECQVCITKEVDGNKNYMFVGYDNYSYPGQIDTHTIVVTEGDTQIIIDLSLGHLLPPNKQYIIERVTTSKKDLSSEHKENVGKDVFAEFDFGSCGLTYYEKKNLRLPSIHQKNLIQRIVNEQNVEKSLEALKLFIIAALGLALINFTMNITLIVLRLFDISWV